jgi:hypothetical protein
MIITMLSLITTPRPPTVYLAPVRTILDVRTTDETSRGMQSVGGVSPPPSPAQSGKDHNLHGIPEVTSGKEMVPQRRYAPENSRLPARTPILGLGCSSFSSFFSPEDGESLTADTISRENSIVCEWVETIR